MMVMIKTVSSIIYSFLFLALAGTIGGSFYYIGMAPGVPPANEPVQEPGWTPLEPGLQTRVIEIFDDQHQQVETLHIWRIDQNFFRLDIAVAETPKSLEAWQKETDAALVVNGGYYSIENERYFADGLTIINGRPFGRSFTGFGGMLAMSRYRAELRWLVEQPYNSHEPLESALQSFPMLVLPGGGLGFDAERENHVAARRTIIAQDRYGRILFMVAPQGYFTLHWLSRFLTESDLNLDVAVNLDGGGSTGILVANPWEVIPPTRPLPFVILVFSR